LQQFRSKSRNATLVVFEHSTKPFTGCDPTSDRTRIQSRLTEFITEPLMISPCVAVLEIRLHGVLK